MIALYHFLMSISHQAKQNYNGQKKFQSAEGFKPLLVFTLENITRNVFRYSLIHKYVYQSALHIFLTITLFLVLWKQFYLLHKTKQVYYLPMYLVTIDLTPTTACRQISVPVVLLVLSQNINARNLMCFCNSCCASSFIL